MIKIYTDASVNDKSGVAGISFIVLVNNKEVLNTSYQIANISDSGLAECMAIELALTDAKPYMQTGWKVLVFTDLMGIVKDWNKPILNTRRLKRYQGIRAKVQEVLTENFCIVEIRKVKAHASCNKEKDHQYNRRVDINARAAMRTIKQTQ